MPSYLSSRMRLAEELLPTTVNTAAASESKFSAKTLPDPPGIGSCRRKAVLKQEEPFYGRVYDSSDYDLNTNSGGTVTSSISNAEAAEAFANNLDRALSVMRGGAPILLQLSQGPGSHCQSDDSIQPPEICFCALDLKSQNCQSEEEESDSEISADEVTDSARLVCTFNKMERGREIVYIRDIADVELMPEEDGGSEDLKEEDGELDSSTLSTSTVTAQCCLRLVLRRGARITENRTNYTEGEKFKLNQENQIKPEEEDDSNFEDLFLLFATKEDLSHWYEGLLFACERCNRRQAREASLLAEALRRENLEMRQMLEERNLLKNLEDLKGTSLLSDDDGSESDGVSEVESENLSDNENTSEKLLQQRSKKDFESEFAEFVENEYGREFAEHLKLASSTEKPEEMDDDYLDRLIKSDVRPKKIAESTEEESESEVESEDSDDLGGVSTNFKKQNLQMFAGRFTFFLHFIVIIVFSIFSWIYVFLLIYCARATLFSL